MQPWHIFHLNNGSSPTQVIAFICGVIVGILMILALTSTDWLMAESWRQGLFVHCIEEDYSPPLPFNLQDPAGCYASRDVSEYLLFQLPTHPPLDGNYPK